MRRVKVHLIAAALFVWVSIATQAFANIMPSVQNIAEILAMAIGCFGYIISVLKRPKEKGLVFSKMEIYLFVTSLLVFFSAYRAYVTFNQPLFYGVATRRAMLLCFGAAWIYRLLLNGKLNAAAVNLALKYFCIIWPLVFLFIYKFIPASVMGEVSEHIIKGGDEVVFRFSYIPFIVGIIFLDRLWIFKRSLPALLLEALYMATIIFFLGKRSAIVVLPLSYLLIRCMVYEGRKLFLWAVSCVILFTGMSLVYVNLGLSVGSEFIARLNEAIDAVMNNATVADISASARVMEFQRVKDYLIDNIAFGSGDLSQQGLHTYQTMIGYFYPSDIGVFGIIFVFGVLGAVILFYQVVFLLKAIRITRSCVMKDQSSITCLTISGYMMAISLINAAVAFMPYASLTFLVLGYGLVQCQNHNSIMDLSSKNKEDGWKIGISYS